MYRVHWFLLVALVWTWAFWWPVALSSAGIISSEVPETLMAAALLLPLLASAIAWSESGLSGVKSLWLSLRLRSVAGKTYLFTLLPAVLLLASMFTAAQTLAADASLQIPLSFGLVGILVLALVEELTWRGYALPRLISRHGAIRGNVILGTYWTIWHLPAFWIVGYNAWGPAGYLAWAPYYFVYSFFLSWLYLASRQSVFLPVVSHFTVNWVIVWYQPAYMENIAAMGAAILLVPVCVVLYKRGDVVLKNDSPGE